MKRLALLTASLLTALGCASLPTASSDGDEAANAARAKAALESASQSGISARIALN
jgi:hypothetical protein